MINVDALQSAMANFAKGEPFHHCVIDDFVSEDLARQLEADFVPYDAVDPQGRLQWFDYNNPLENKRALNNWNFFPATTYQFFEFLNSGEFVDLLGACAGIKLISDSGLNGGGWHSHGPGGKLNHHLDYSIHPKLGLQRKLNLILYISADLKPEHGGHLGLWEHNSATNSPGKLIREIEPKYRRAVIFDTTQNSWHGISRALSQPEGIYRKSLAAYYLCEPPADVDPRGRALFAPREEQKGNAEIEELIKKRSGVATSGSVYQTKR